MDKLTALEQATNLQNILIARATGGSVDETEYLFMRNALLENPKVAALLPPFVRTCRDLSQFWAFIKARLGTYAERRDFLWNAFAPLLDCLEGRATKPADAPISDGLKRFDVDGVHAAWAKALERRTHDPEGAITAARTLLETVCKHILDDAGVVYAKDKIELPDLYKRVSKELNLAPSQHTHDIFKQTLGGVASVVHGLGAMRNRLGDAHGKDNRAIRPAPRHAEFAVNLAGTTALFIVETWQARSASRSRPPHSGDASR